MSPTSARRWTVFAVCMLALAAAAWAIGHHLQAITPEHITLVLDDERIEIAGIDGLPALAAGGGLLIGLLVLLVVVPLVLLFGVGLPLLVLAALLVVGLVCIGLALAAVLSPLLLFGLFVWWLARRSRSTVSTTIAA